MEEKGAVGAEYDVNSSPHKGRSAPPPRQLDIEVEALKAYIRQLEAALEPLACTCPAKHQMECSRSEVDCPFWNARAALAQEKQ